MDEQTPQPVAAQQVPTNGKLDKIKTWLIQNWQKIAIGAVIVLTVTASLMANNYLTKKEPRSGHQEAANVEPPKPKTKASPLTGVELAPELADRPVRAFVIENHTAARPQSSLGQAGVVYEALAEGGITRFMALYLEQQPPSLGPIRSLRPYFMDWALEFHSPLGHVGGSYDALNSIVSKGLASMNQFSYGSYYFRSRDRFAPHNVYTTTELMDKMLVALQQNKPATFTPNPRQDDNPPKEGEAAPHPVITVNYSSITYQARYDYDTATNDYKRFLAGAPHIERNTGEQIRVKNIVIQFMPTSYRVDAVGKTMTVMQTIGSGRALVFRDGKVVEGTWNKKGLRNRTKLLDQDGKEIPLNRGNTWYNIVPTDKTVQY